MTLFGKKIITIPYTTTFGLTENPISEGGVWTTGLGTGLDWTNPQTGSGRAFGTMTEHSVPPFDDSIAHLSGFANDHYAQGTMHDGAPSNSMEAELLLRFQITANSARGYEILIGSAGPVELVRWNGDLNDFTQLETWDFGGKVDGDIWYASIVGTLITIIKNTNEQTETYDTVSDDPIWSDGNPGIGFFNTGAAPDDEFGWIDYEADNL